MKMKRKIGKKLAYGGKRTVSILLCLFILSLNLAVAGAEQLASNRTVKAGVFYFDGYHMEGENGSLTGYGIEFLNLVSQYSHLNFSFCGYDKSWEDMLDMLDRGEIDVVTSARKTPEREKRYAFSLPIGRNSTVLSIRSDNTSQLCGNYGTYDGITVGVLVGSSQNQRLAEFAQKNGFSYHAKEYSDSAMMAEDLQNGSIDAILSSNLRRTENEKTLDTIETDYFYAIVRKEDSALLSEINYAIDQMNINEGDWSNVLFYKYYGNSAPAGLFFTEREQAYIQEVAAGRKRITVTSMGDRRPYSYVEDGDLKGILPEYFDSLMEVAGLPYETVVPGDRAEYYALIEDDSVDVVIDWRQDQLKATEFGRTGFYSDAYLNTGVALVTRKDFSGRIDTLAVADLQGDVAVEQNLLGDAEVLNCNTRESALQAVVDGKADATYVYTYTAQSFVNNDPAASLQYSTVDSMRFDFRLHVRSSCDHELITILNKCIGQMTDDTMSRLITKYTANTPGNVSFGQYMRAHPGIIAVLVLLAAAAIGIMIALYLRSRWNKKLLRTTELANQTLESQLAIVNTLSRDYINVYAVDSKTGSVNSVKVEGYAAAGLETDSKMTVSLGELLKDYIRYRVLPEDQPYLSKALALDTVVEKLRDSTEYSGSYRVRIDGEVHTYQFICAAYSSEGGHGWDRGDLFLLGFRNIDEIVRREQEQKAVLETALAEAQHANISKTTFLNSMSHDIRTPMNAIIGFTSLAVSHIDNQAQVGGYLDKILTASKHLLSLINDILDMSRIESGKVNIEESEASLPEIIHDLKTIVQADVKSKQLSLHMDTLNVKNETVICDKLRLTQVLLNVLSNSIKYTEPGGTVSVLIVQTDDAPDGYAAYQFHFQDTGIGMSREFLAHIFEPFERERTSTVSGIQGTGLGLAITKNIVDMMNGTITVASEEGRGSEFVVSFRFRVKDDMNAAEDLEKLAGLRVLMAGENASACTSMSNMLSSGGMRPEWTTQGRDAVRQAELAMGQNDPFSVFLIDQQLPDLDGIEIARQLRNIAGEKAIIIILTAYDWADIESDAKDAGITEFCSKPLFLSELLDVLTASCRETQGTDEQVGGQQLLRGKRMLLVEDNELNQEIAKTVLEEAGLIIDTADDGTEAVEAVRTAQAGTYDMILMDIQMPIMDGYTAARTIRAMDDPAKSSIPIVAMTANAFEEDRQRALDAEMDGHIPKPLDIPKLIKTLWTILEEKSER